LASGAFGAGGSATPRFAPGADFGAAEPPRRSLATRSTVYDTNGGLFWGKNRHGATATMTITPAWIASETIIMRVSAL